MIVLRQDCCPCIGDSDNRNPCKKKLRIDYSWCGCSDLDTHTSYGDCSVGWDCENACENIQWVTGDDRSDCGSESVEVEVEQSSGTQFIYCSAKWYAGCSDDEDGLSRNCMDSPDTSCPITITVSGCGQTHSKVVQTSVLSDSCASGNILALVEIYADGSFYLL